MIQTPYTSTSPAAPTDLVEGITQIMNHVANNNKWDDTSKQMMKNIKVFNGSNKAECINWISQVEAAAKFTNTPFHELICQSMAPAMLHVFSELSAMATDEDIKEAILTNYSDIPSTTEAAMRLQNIQIAANEPLVTFNHRYEAIHKVAFSMSTKQQENKTVMIEYAKKLPVNTRDKLLRKIAKKNSYIKTLDDAFKQAIDINRETSFVEAATGKYSDHNNTRIDTQINELEDSFQDYDINAMSTRNLQTDQETDPGTTHSTNCHREIILSIHHIVLDQVSEITVIPATKMHKIDRDFTETTPETGDTNKHRDTTREIKATRTDMRTTKTETGLITEGRPNKYQHHRNQHKAQVIFEFSDQNMMEMMQTVRGFINLIKANPTTRDHYKTNKLANRKYDNEVNESEIKSSNLDQVQQFFNKDADIVFDALVAVDYIDEIDCTDGARQPSASLPEKYNPQDYFTEVAENVDIYNIDELGPTTGTVFQTVVNNNLSMKINTLFDTGAMKSVMSLEMYEKLKLNNLNTTSIPHVVGASGESLGVRGRTRCEININGRTFYQTFIVCEHLKRPIILGRDFSIQNCIGISWTKSNTRQLTQNNEVIAETTEYQSPSRASVSLKRNIKVPPRSYAVVDVDINSTEEIKVEVIPDQLWLSANPNICTYPMIADLKDRQPDAVTPFVIVNFSHHEHLHLPKDHVVAFAEKDSNEGEVLEICTMEQLEKEIPRNWIPSRKQQEKLNEFFENPFEKKDDDFLKSPAEVPVHRKVLLEDKNISPKTQKAFDKLCEKYNDIISKNSGDIGKTMLVEMEIYTGNHPPPSHSIKTLHTTTKTLQMGTERNRNTRKSRNHRKKHLTMGVTRSDSPQEERSRRTAQKENVHRL